MILGSLAAMLVAFLGLMNGTSPGTCLAKAGAAFLVFAGFGLVIRFALMDVETPEEKTVGAPLTETQPGSFPGNLDVIVPGTSVADLLGGRPNEVTQHAAHEEDAAA